jgi:hypothetical protein
MGCEHWPLSISSQNTHTHTYLHSSLKLISRILHPETEELTQELGGFITGASKFVLSSCVVTVINKEAGHVACTYGETNKHTSVGCKHLREGTTCENYALMEDSLIRKKSDTTQNVPSFNRSNWIIVFNSNIQNWRIRNCKYLRR